MRYVTWKLNWADDYGYGPEPLAAEHGANLEASAFCSPQTNTGTILGYLTGDLNFEAFTVYQLTEITPEEALEFAQAIAPTAHFTSDGYLVAAKESIID